MWTSMHTGQMVCRWIIHQPSVIEPRAARHRADQAQRRAAKTPYVRASNSKGPPHAKAPLMGRSFTKLQLAQLQRSKPV
jgi:hypothetical protein